jgi:hypothetical protein
MKITYRHIAVLIVAAIVLSLFLMLNGPTEMPEAVALSPSHAYSYNERVELPLQLEGTDNCPSLVVGWNRASLSTCEPSSAEDAPKRERPARVPVTITTNVPVVTIITTPVPTITADPTSTPDPTTTPDPTDTPEPQEEDGCKNKNSGKDGTPDECNAGGGQEKQAAKTPKPKKDK